MKRSEIAAVPFERVRIADSFWSPLLELAGGVALRACLDQCGRTGRIRNFQEAAHCPPEGKKGGFSGKFFNDSDVYKVVEGAAYALRNRPDPALEEEVDGIIAQIAAAQEEDGYLMTWYTLEEPEKKWSDMDKHEMYCIGHLIEAALAYKHSTGKTLLYDTARRAADLLCRRFGPGRDHWVPGHEEIELALIKLSREAGEQKYLDLALFLLEERGRGRGRGTSWDTPEWGAPYCQDDRPVSEIERVGGHAVRAMYLYAAMADAALRTELPAYEEALERVWANVVDKNLYITGGIGPSAGNEGFTEDYDLPNRGAYCETCASAGMIFWNRRMGLLHRDARYADLVERELYNGLISGLSRSGDRFFYENPLESDGTHRRSEWYKVSCCPTQLVRVIPSVGGYLYAQEGDQLYVDLYAAGEAELSLGGKPFTLRQETAYPWEGRVSLRLEGEGASALSALALRLPGWCPGFTLRVGGEERRDPEIRKGYLRLPAPCAGKTSVEVVLDMAMPLQIWTAREEVKADRGRAALSRGPLVYCFEEEDNRGALAAIRLSGDETAALAECPDLGKGVRALVLTGSAGRFTAIPYYLWDNRGAGAMKTWIPADQAVPEADGPGLYRPSGTIPFEV